MNLLLTDGKLVIVTDDELQFVVTPCRGHGYHIKPVAEVSLTEAPRELNVDEALALINFIANGFAMK